MPRVLICTPDGVCHHAWVDRHEMRPGRTAFEGTTRGWFMCMPNFFPTDSVLHLSDGPVTCLECLAEQNNNGTLSQ